MDTKRRSSWKAAEPEELEEPEDKLAAILESDREVIEDLKDE